MDSHAGNETIIQRIVRLIKEKGVNEKSFCNYIGVSQSTFVNWKNRGTNPNAKYLSNAARFLGVTEKYLISGAEKQPEVDVEMDSHVIGGRIKQRRLEIGMTLEDVANMVGVAVSTIQRYERGKIEKIKLPVVESIARVLRVSPEWLIGKTDDMQSKKPSTEKQPEVDDETRSLQDYLEEVRTRPEMRTLFSVAKGASKEDIEKAVKIIEMFKGE